MISFFFIIYYPLPEIDVLCNMLENLEYQEMNVIERGWVINIMREVGVTYLALFEVFNEIYEKRVSNIFFYYKIITYNHSLTIILIFVL